MLSSFWKSTTNRIIVLISLTFVLITSAENIFLYHQLKEKLYEQVDGLMSTTLYSFGRTLDNAFYYIESSGKAYRTYLINAAKTGTLNSTNEEFTYQFLYARPDVVSLAVLATNGAPFRSCQYINSPNKIITIDSINESDNFKYRSVLKFCQQYADSNISAFWTPVYVSAAIEKQPPITTIFLPIRDTSISRQLLGVIAISIKITFFEQRLSTFTLGSNSMNILLDNENRILYHPQTQFALNHETDNWNWPNDLDATYKHYRATRKAHSEPIMETEVINSINNFDCPQSLAMSYIMHNGWKITTLFYRNPLPASPNKFASVLLSVSIFASVVFLIVLIAIINRALKDVSAIANAIITWNKYDVYDWKLPQTANQHEFKIFADTFNELYTDYRIAQNKLAESLLKNEQLMNNELRVETRIKQAVAEETAELIAHNKVLDIAFSNLSELNELGKIISSSLNLEEISFAIFNRLTQLVPVNFFGVLIFDKDSNTLICKTGILNGQQVEPFTINIIEKNNIAIKCWERNEPIFINNFDLEYMNHLLVTSYNPLNISMASQYYAPISDNDRQVGVFTIQSIYKSVFKDFNLDILSILHTYLSISIKNIVSFEELQSSVKQLNAAQTKLILSEKMASMGQLAAGISHEIKNPLNFVINFSELSNLLIEDIKTEVQNYTTENGIIKHKSFIYIEDMLDNLRLNIDKIGEHSRRADKIIKGMLQLSRGKSGEFTPVQINDLIMEYTKLAYHGLRATDPLFHVDVAYDLDNNLGKVSVVPHNISRVIINIVANACVATFKKHKEQNPGTKPEVKISTKDMGKEFAVIVWDNGVGIPEANRDKIFNPFFTTKLSSEGTGLGLAISYDIVVVEHSGDIVFESEENEYTEFKVILPKNIV